MVYGAPYLGHAITNTVDIGWSTTFAVVFVAWAIVSFVWIVKG